jgi:short subunit dehydrogenase-like uncharacterized protein
MSPVRFRQRRDQWRMRASAIAFITSTSWAKSTFEALAARDAQARARGVMLLPGVGFDVAPSDCLAARWKRRLLDAKDLKFYLTFDATVSRGTAKTMIEAIAAGTRLLHRHSQHRAPYRVVAGGDGVCPHASVRQVVTAAGLIRSIPAGAAKWIRPQRNSAAAGTC